MELTTILEYAGVLGFLLLSLAVHESAHAWVAERLGDPTGRLLGRVTLNPIAHIDPFLTILLPLFTYSLMGVPFGAGKPVPVNVLNLRNPRRDWMLVALAGPASNIAFALVTTAAWWLLDSMHLVPRESLGILILRVGVWLNVVLAVFNLIPIPALDGSRVVGYLLPRGMADRWYDLDRYGFLIIAGLLVLPNVDPRLDVLGWILRLAGGTIIGGLQAVSHLPLY